MGRKTREPHSCMTAGYGEATEATALPGVTARVRRWSCPRTLGGRGLPDGEEDRPERSPRHADAPAHTTAACDQPDQPSQDYLNAYHLDDANSILAVPSRRFSPPPTPVVGGLPRSREFQHSHGPQARAWDPPVWDLPHQAAKRPAPCPPQDRAHAPRGRRMALSDRLRGGEGGLSLGAGRIGGNGPRLHIASEVAHSL